MKPYSSAVSHTVTGLIILCSFFTFSENFFPLLNSDMAVNILMTPSFSIPHDIYFWGQDRSGSLIPAIAHFFYRITGWQPVVIVSLVHYMILAAGFWALTRFIRTAAGRIAAAMIWFFPPWHFLEFLLILYGVQASCVLLAMNFLNRSFNSGNRWKNLAWISLASLTFIVAVWVSDMALISLLALLCMAAVYYFATLKDAAKKVSLRGMLVPLFCIAAWAFAGMLILHYAKQISTPVLTYNEGFLASPASILSSLRIVLESIVGILVFSGESQVESVFLWALIAGLLFLLLYRHKRPLRWPRISSDYIHRKTKASEDFPSAEVIWGTGTDQNLGDNISVTIIATGFDPEHRQKDPSKPHDVKVHDLYGQKIEPKVQKRFIEPRITFPSEPVEPKTEKSIFAEPSVEQTVLTSEPVMEASIELIPETAPRTVEFQLENPQVFIQPETIVSETISLREPELVDEIKPVRSEEAAPSVRQQPVEHPFPDHSQDDHDRRANERVNKLRALSEKLKNHTPIDPSNIYELEAVPAYKRRNVDLLDVTPSSEPQAPSYSLGENADKSLEIRSENSFLHKNVD